MSEGADEIDGERGGKEEVAPTSTSRLLLKTGGSAIDPMVIASDSDDGEGADDIIPLSRGEAAGGEEKQQKQEEVDDEEEEAGESFTSADAEAILFAELQSCRKAVTRGSGKKCQDRSGLGGGGADGIQQAGAGKESPTGCMRREGLQMRAKVQSKQEVVMEGGSAGNVEAEGQEESEDAETERVDGTVQQRKKRLILFVEKVDSSFGEKQPGLVDKFYDVLSIYHKVCTSRARAHVSTTEISQTSVCVCTRKKERACVCAGVKARHHHKRSNRSDNVQA